MPCRIESGSSLSIQLIPGRACGHTSWLIRTIGFRCVGHTKCRSKGKIANLFSARRRSELGRLVPTRQCIDDGTAASQPCYGSMTSLEKTGQRRQSVLVLLWGLLRSSSCRTTEPISQRPVIERRGSEHSFPYYYRNVQKQACSLQQHPLPTELRRLVVQWLVVMVEVAAHVVVMLVMDMPFVLLPSSCPGLRCHTTPSSPQSVEQPFGGSGKLRALPLLQKKVATVLQGVCKSLRLYVMALATIVPQRLLNYLFTAI